MRRAEAAAILLIVASCTPVVECEIAHHLSSSDAGADGATGDSGSTDGGGGDAATSDAGAFCPFDAADYSPVVDYNGQESDGGPLWPRSFAGVGLVAFHGGVPGLEGQSVFAFETDAGLVEICAGNDTQGLIVLLPLPNTRTPLRSLSATAMHPPVPGAMVNGCAEVFFVDVGGKGNLWATEASCVNFDGGASPDVPVGTGSNVAIGWSDAGPLGTLAIVSGQDSWTGPEVAYDGGGPQWVHNASVSPSVGSLALVESVALDAGLKWIVESELPTGDYGSQLYNFNLTPFLGSPLPGPRELRPVPYSPSQFVVGTLDGGQLVVRFWDATLAPGNFGPVGRITADSTGSSDRDSLQAGLISLLDGGANQVRFAWTVDGHVRYADLDPVNMSEPVVRELCAPEPIVYVAPLDDIHMLIRGQSGTLWIHNVP